MSSWAIRQSTGDDRALIDDLLTSARWKHLHLDWLEPTALAGRRPFLLAKRDESPVACLGCPPDLPSVAWVRAFAVAEGSSASTAWDHLWEAAVDELEQLGVENVAAMAIDSWFGSILRHAGFNPSNEVVFYEYELGGLPGQGNAEVRDIAMTDLASVLELDAAAFDPFWRLSAESLQAAIEQAMSASVVERNGSLAGYQVTTGSAFGAHLARLAVHPRLQRRGVGSALVLESIRAAQRLGLGRLSVNTQADNTPSQALYLKLGFRETGQRYPVLFSSLRSN